MSQEKESCTLRISKCGAASFFSDRLEINGYNPGFCDIGDGSTAEVAYHDGIAVDDFFYEHYEADE